MRTDSPPMTTEAIENIKIQEKTFEEYFQNNMEIKKLNREKKYKEDLKQEAHKLVGLLISKKILK